MKHRRTLSGLAALMLAASLPMSALAREWDIADGDITIVADNDGQKVSQGTENDISDDNPIDEHRQHRGREGPDRHLHLRRSGRKRDS